ncbi:MAG: hypothetical protein EXS39_01625 [Opitutaceae bacterium]|nr:hypothetical protein [Opitutaceae bacterium]
MNAEKSSWKVLNLIRRGLGLDDDPGLPDEQKRARNRRRAETLIAICWGLIVLKSVVVIWAVSYYAIPINPMWVIAPTVIFAFVTTAAYYLLRD